MDVNRIHLTNDFGLPGPLVEALSRHEYDKGESDYSVTELVSPPRIAQLKRQHSGQLSDDASNRIFALLGEAIHVILERSAEHTRYIVEKRYFLTHDGARISGQIDVYDSEEKALQDWKITSYHAVSDGAKPEWVAQGNINRFLLHKNGVEVKRIDYVAIFRDWSRMMASRRPNDYPQAQVRIIPLPLWPMEKTASYISERIRLHREAAEVLPMCSEEERWTRPHKWAVMEKGKKRAIKLHDSREQAEAHITNLPELKRPKAYLEERPGEETRCLFFCPVVSFCSFGREALLLAAKA